MADIADVMDALEAIALRAVFPNGTAPGQSSILAPPKVVAVGQGWPLTGDLDAKVAKGRFTLVSIYAVPGSTGDAGQPFNTTDDVVSGPDIGLIVTATADGLTLTGTPKLNEYVTVETARGQIYDTSAIVGDTATSFAARLAARIAIGYPGTTATGGTITVAPTPPHLSVRQGSPALMARRIHRQRAQFRISVWASNPADRAKVAKAIDVAMKSKNVIRLPEDFPMGSQGLLTYVNSNMDDKYEDEGVYRRDLIFNVTYDTIDTYQAYVVTTVQVAVLPPG